MNFRKRAWVAALASFHASTKASQSAGSEDFTTGSGSFCAGNDGVTLRRSSGSVTARVREKPVHGPLYRGLSAPSPAREKLNRLVLLRQRARYVARFFRFRNRSSLASAGCCYAQTDFWQKTTSLCPVPGSLLMILSSARPFGIGLPNTLQACSQNAMTV